MVKTTWMRAVLLLPFVFAAQGTGQEEKRIVKVTPEETDEILANPGMGWETFHRTSKADKSLPSWIPSTVQYARWGWRELEPEPGKIDYAFLDKMLKESRDNPNTKRLLAELAALKPKTLAAMHGSTFVGDGEKALLDLGSVLKELLGS